MGNGYRWGHTSPLLSLGEVTPSGRLSAALFLYGLRGSTKGRKREPKRGRIVDQPLLAMGPRLGALVQRSEPRRQERATGNVVTTERRDPATPVCTVAFACVAL